MGSKIGGESSDPFTARQQAEPRWALLLIGGAILAGVAASVHSRTQSTVGSRTSDVRFVGQPMRSETPSAIQSGQRWLFRVSPMHGGPEGFETWDILSIDSQCITAAATSPSASHSAMPSTWFFDLRVRPQGPVELVGSETIPVDGSSAILCDIVECADLGGDLIRSWVAVSRPGGLLQFPGVVRQMRLESRGRRVMEWELVRVTRTDD